MCLVVIGFMAINVFPILARSSGIGDILVDSDITENTRLRLEMFLYKANDQDQNYDYYLVELNMFEKAYSNDVLVEIWDIQTYIYYYASIDSKYRLKKLLELNNTSLNECLEILRKFKLIGVTKDIGPRNRTELKLTELGIKIAQSLEKNLTILKSTKTD